MAMALGLAQALAAAPQSTNLTPQSTNLTRRSTGCVGTPKVAFQGLRATRGVADAVNVQRLRQHAVATAPRRRASGAAVRCTATNGSSGMKHSGMNIVFVAAEVAPWSRTGGLGDVLGGLPPALAARGHRVMTVSPRYDQYKDAWDTNTPLEITINGRTETVNFFHTHERGVDRVFVDHPLFLAKVWGKTGSRIYGPSPGEDYDDNQFRFQLLAKAAIEAARVLSLDCNESFSGPYGEDVVFVANDWHTALLPCYLKSEYKPAGQFVNAKVAFCVHNTACQGRFASADFDRLGLPDKFRNSFMDGYGESGRRINWMKAGLLESDQELNANSEMEDVTLLSDTMKRAIKVRGCMGEDLSWKGPARTWEDTLLELHAEDFGPGQEGEEIAPIAKANVAAP